MYHTKIFEVSKYSQIESPIHPEGEPSQKWRILENELLGLYKAFQIMFLYKYTNPLAFQSNY